MSTEVEVLPPDSPTVAALGLAPDDRGALVRPAAALSDIVQAFADYQSMCVALLDESDHQQMGSRSFRKKSAWRKLAVAFGVSVHLVSKDYERDARGRIVRAEVLVRAEAPNGRYFDGLGSCDAFERCCDAVDCKKARYSDHTCCSELGYVCSGFSHFSHAQHDIPSTAMTRATNRACADLFGFGEVSAEEMSDGDQGSAPRRQETAKSPASRVPTPTEPVPEGFVDHKEAAEMHRLVLDLIKALPEAIDREPLREYRSQVGSWPMTKDQIEHWARMAGDARRAHDEREAASAIPASPQDPPGSPDSASGAAEAPTPPVRVVGPLCVACQVGGDEVAATTAIDGVELCDACEAEEYGAADDARAAAAE